jgi:hypothetical protein
LADGTDIEICTWLDDHFRLCLGGLVAPVFTAPAIDSLYRAIAAEHGDPAGLLCDNGAVFTGRFRDGGRVALEVTLHARGVVLGHPGPTTRTPATGSNASTRLRRSGWPASRAPPPSPTFSSSSTSSATTTTTFGRTAPWTAAPRPSPTPPALKPPPRASR